MPTVLLYTQPFVCYNETLDKSNDIQLDPKNKVFIEMTFNNIRLKHFQYTNINSRTDTSTSWNILIEQS